MNGQMQIKVNSRIHLNLISMHSEGYRINGGIGFATKKPSITCNFSKANKFKIIDERKFPLSSSERDILINILLQEKNQYQFSNDIKIIIKGDMGTHQGLGSGTSIRLSCLEALHIINNSKIDKDSLITSSKRGGTSGVGIRTYFDGGAVFDLGKKSNVFQPSSLNDDRKIPLVLDHIPMCDWNLFIFIPQNIKLKSQEEEVAFFKRTCPISEESSFVTLYHSLFGVWSSIKENDLDTFCKAIKKIQSHSWKSAERNEYGDELKNIEAILYFMGAKAVAMSSLGPSLLFILEDNENCSKISNRLKNCLVLPASAANQGREVI